MKIRLNIDYEEIRNRINKEKEGFKPGEWAKKVGVSPNVVSNVHGKIRQKPSIEYIIAVAVATGKSVEYFLFGDDCDETSQRSSVSGKPPHTVIVDRFQQKKLAWDISYKLLWLESFNPKELKDIDDFINYRISKYDRRSGEDRRKEDISELTPEDDRRSGIERRVANLKS
jgi:transcriptional regulator with XRE-family HTH domain